MGDDNTESDKIFVGALAWNTTEQSMKDYFSKYGEVLQTSVMTDKVTQRSRGFGFVRFIDPSCIDAVLQDGPHFLDDRQIDPKPCTPKAIQMQKRNAAIEHVQTHKIFIGGIARDATEADVREYFQTLGTVTEVVFVLDNVEKKHKGFGFVTFDKAEAVDQALDMHFHDIKGRKVEAKRAQPRDKMLTGTVRPLHKEPQSQYKQQYDAGPPNDYSYGYGMPPQGMTQGPSGGWVPMSNSSSGMGMGYGYGYSQNYGQSYYGYDYGAPPQGHSGYGQSGGMPDYSQSQSSYGPSKSSHGPSAYDSPYNGAGGAGGPKKYGSSQSYHPYKR